MQWHLPIIPKKSSKLRSKKSPPDFKPDVRPQKIVQKHFGQKAVGQQIALTNFVLASNSNDVRLTENSKLHQVP